MRAWLMAPHEYEPDYDAYWRDLESLEEAIANVATYDDWFPDIPIVAQQQCGVCGSPQYDTPHGVTCANGHGGAPSL